MHLGIKIHLAAEVVMVIVRLVLRHHRIPLLPDRLYIETIELRIVGAVKAGRQ